MTRCYVPIELTRMDSDPDHNTLWRFYKSNRQSMRKLLKRTVQTALGMDLIDLTLQAVDGTKVGANATGDRTLDGEGLERLLRRVDQSLKELEAENETGEDAAPAHLPDELTEKTVTEREGAPSYGRTHRSVANLRADKPHG